MDSDYHFVEAQREILKSKTKLASPNFSPATHIPGGYRTYGFCIIPGESGNYINDDLSKEEPKRGGVPEYFGRGVDR